MEVDGELKFLGDVTRLPSVHTNTMEFDPSARDGPPPRHAIESDSEDSEEDDVKRSSRSTKEPFQEPQVLFRSSDGTQASLPTGLPLTLLVGEAGEAYARTLRIGVQAFIVVNEDTQGALATDAAQSNGNTALIRLDARSSSDPSKFAYIAASILAQLRPSSVTLVDEYFTALYIHSNAGDGDESSQDQAPIRVLHGVTPSVSNTSIPTFAPPNYLTGLVASFVSEALIVGVPLSALLLPQRRSFNPHLQSMHTIAQSSDALQPSPGELDGDIKQQLDRYLNINPAASSMDLKQVGLDDFLQHRRREARKTQREQVSSMYM